MTEDVRICPECGAEYFAHIVKCKGCDVELVRPGEKRPVAKPEDELVCVVDGDYHRIKELAAYINAAGIECKALGMEDGKSCSKDSAFGVFVPAPLVPEASRIMQKFRDTLYPEINDADERFLSGQCPACGADIKKSPMVCADCGLTLVIGPPDDDCNNCGKD